MVVWHTSFQGEEPWMRDAGFNRIIMYTHVCEKKGPASAASASEVFYMTISNLYETHMRTGNG